MIERLPKTSFSIDLIFRYGLCYGVILLFFILDIQITGFFLDAHFKAILTLPVIYYWAIFRPSLMPIWLLFALGIIKDLILGLPLLGLSSLIFIAVFASTKYQRVFLAGQSFIMMWAGYMVMSLLSMLCFWIMLCSYHISFQPVFEFVLESIIMILAFPLVLPLLGLSHRYLPFASKHTSP